MANTKISALTSATLPLAGTETLPIVQSSTTKKIATDDLTVKNIRANATTGILQVTGPAAATTRIATVPNANFTVARTDAAQSFTGDQTLSTGNLVIGTSGKGIDFSATPNTGTSELFADYEEGTYTVAITCGTTGTVTLNTSFDLAQYTKVGRLVTVTGGVIVSSVLLPVGYFTISLPFTAANLTELSGYFGAVLTLTGVNTANIADFVSLGVNGASSMRVYLGAGTGLQATSANELKAGTEIYFVISYIAA
jgi:hypothetical protein